MSIVDAVAWRNPVLHRELKQRASTPRMMLVITLYLVVLTAVVFALYQARTGDRTGSFGQPGVTEIASIGQSLFEYVLFFMVILVLFIVPGFTASSIAGERERQTLRALQVSLLSPRSIVFGKVGASVAATVLLLVASLPLLAVAYLIGGITFGEIFISLGVVLFAAFGLACITVACSAIVKRVSGAILLAYGIVLLLVGGTFVGYAVLQEVDASRGSDLAQPPSWVMAANPLAAVADVSQRSVSDQTDDDQFGEFGPFGPSFGNSQVESPLSAVRDLMQPKFPQNGFGFNDGPFPVPIPVGIDEFGNVIQDNRGGNDQGASDDGDRVPFIAEFFILFTALSVTGLAIAIWRVRTPARTER